MWANLGEPAWIGVEESRLASIADDRDLHSASTSVPSYEKAKPKEDAPI